jgi:predicted AlkP superfamily phosphohydrolase/phosphomutase
LYGKNVKNRIIKGAKIIDIAPTILELIGIKANAIKQFGEERRESWDLCFSYNITQLP